MMKLVTKRYNPKYKIKLNTQIQIANTPTKKPSNLELSKRKYYQAVVSKYIGSFDCFEDSLESFRPFHVQ